MYRLLRSRNYSPVGYYRGMATTEFETVQKMTEEQLGKVTALPGSSPDWRSALARSMRIERGKRFLWTFGS
jgi:hypothetical protein